MLATVVAAQSCQRAHFTAVAFACDHVCMKTTRTAEPKPSEAGLITNQANVGPETKSRTLTSYWPASRFCFNRNGQLYQAS